MVPIRPVPKYPVTPGPRHQESRALPTELPVEITVIIVIIINTSEKANVVNWV